MSDFEKIALGKQVGNLEISPQFASYSGVEIIVDDDTAIFSGDRSGRVLTIENKWGTQEQADNILSSLRGFQYQPYTASNAILPPNAEIGDGVTINGVYSGVYKISRDYGPLMVADIEAPQDEEIDHEYPYESKQDRIYRREIADAQAQIKINHESIEAEVIRASQAEGTLSSQISQTATGIRADVVAKTGGSSSSFGWNLSDSSWTLTSNNSEVLKATSSGIEVTGKITATSGFIGNGSNGFTITASSIYNGMNSISSGSNGIYIGTDGIALGGGNFKVTAGGSVSANNMTLNGTLNIGGSTITAAALRSGAQSAYNNGSYWSGGAGGGYGFLNATSTSSGQYPGYFKATTISCSSIGISGGSGVTTSKLAVTGTSLSVSGITYSYKAQNVVTSITKTDRYFSEIGSWVVQNISYTTGTIYYLGK